MRGVEQLAFGFYYVEFAGNRITPDNEMTAKVPYCSTDNGLPKLRAWMFGINLVWEVNDGSSVDVAAERFLMCGLDEVPTDRAYTDAYLFTVEAVSWR